MLRFILSRQMFECYVDLSIMTSLGDTKLEGLDGLNLNKNEF
jgi:hypothetical protein